MRSIPFSSDVFPELVTLFQGDGVCILPSETSYGFSASPFSEKAVRQIQEIKGRPEEKPFLLLIASFDDALEYGVFSPEMREFAKERWATQTPTTVLVEKQSCLRDFFPKFSHVGIRVPAFPLLRQFLAILGAPIISTSANISGNEPLFSQKDIELEFGHFSIPFFSFGDLPQKSPSEIWKEENTKLIRVR